MKDKYKCSWKTEAGAACRNWAIRWDGVIPEWHVHACSVHFVAANNYYAIQRRKRVVQLKEAMDEVGGLNPGLAEQLMKALERRVMVFSG